MTEPEHTEPNRTVPMASGGHIRVVADSASPDQEGPLVIAEVPDEYDGTKAVWLNPTAQEVDYLIRALRPHGTGGPVPDDVPPRALPGTFWVDRPEPDRGIVNLYLANGECIHQMGIAEAKAVGLPIPEQPGLADRIRLVHRRHDGEAHDSPICVRCGSEWPCDTILLLEAVNEVAGLEVGASS